MLCISHIFGLNTTPEGLETVVLAFVCPTLKRKEKNAPPKTSTTAYILNSYLLRSYFWKMKELFNSVTYIKYNEMF